MAGLGRKEWSPGDTLTASDVNGYLMDQSVMVFAGTAARASAIPSPSAGMVAYSTATSLQVYDGTDWIDLSTGYGVATGGSSSSITVGGVSYTLLTFLSSSTLTVTKSGLFDIFLVSSGAGGGGAVATVTRGGGGGGSGTIVQTTAYFDANQTVTIGAGGAGGCNTQSGIQGSFSAIGKIYSVGGGAGRGDNTPSVTILGLATGGGGHGETGKTTGASSILSSVFGFAGGNGINASSGGGGGSSQAVGGNASGGTGGAGGVGLGLTTFTGGSITTFVGAGGGGGGLSTGGAAGSVGAGAGGSGAANGAAATANTGSGGGGGGANAAGQTGGNGGSGVLYIRFKV